MVWITPRPFKIISAFPMKTSPNARLVEQTFSGAKLAFRSKTGSFMVWRLICLRPGIISLGGIEAILPWNEDFINWQLAYGQTTRRRIAELM